MPYQRATDVYFTLNNGKKIPALGLGTANYGAKIEETKEAVKIAVKAGYRHIDTAWGYKTEEQIGQALKELFEEGVVKREDLFITTKVSPNITFDPERSLNESLKKLGIEYVDLLLQHWPINQSPVFNEDGSIKRDLPFADPSYKIDYDYISTYKKIEKVYQENPDKIKSIGVSNYSIGFLTNLLNVATVKPVVNQIELHPHLPQKGVVKFNQDHQILITAYSPVGANGAPNLKIPLVQELAKKYDVSANSILASYHIREGRIVIPKSTNEQRIKDVTVLVPLTKEELDALTDFGNKNTKRFIHPDFGKNIGFDFWEEPYIG